MQARVPHPADPAGFARSKLDPTERERGKHAQTLALYRDLLALRRDDPVIGRPGPGFDGAVLGPEAFAVRWTGHDDDRLLVVNLGAELRLGVAPEPLLASPDGQAWRVLWSSEAPKYGGYGTPAPESEEINWRLNGHTATLLAPAPACGDEYRNAEGSV